MTSTKLNIFQIYYDAASRELLQPEFTPLDNTANLRPDWAEYWVIRQWMLANPDLLQHENDWFGWLSPRFTLKTGLTGAAVLNFLNQFKDSDDEVMTFSPFYPFTAFYKNPFEQGDLSHSGFTTLTQRFFDLSGVAINVENLVTHSQNTVWCNYIIAKPKFWKRWFALTNPLFEMAEDPHHELYSTLNTVNPAVSSLSQKVFIQERLTSALLATEPWKIKAYDTFALPSFTPALDPFRNELLACDALKIAYTHTGRAVFMNEFFRLRYEIERRVGTL